jgi:hypothetical protein
MSGKSDLERPGNARRTLVPLGAALTGIVQPPDTDLHSLFGRLVAGDKHWNLEVARLPVEDGVPYATLPPNDPERSEAISKIRAFVNGYEFAPLDQFSSTACFMQGVCNGYRCMGGTTGRYVSLQTVWGMPLIAVGDNYKFVGDITTDDAPWDQERNDDLAFFLPVDHQRWESKPVLVVRNRVADIL